MTSKNSSLDKAGASRVMQRELCRRRIWVIALTLISFLLYYPAVTVMLITRSQSYAELYRYTPLRQREELLRVVSNWIGLRDCEAIAGLLVILAVLIAIEGFSYLYNRRKLDFYESQPVLRSERFRAVYLNGVGIVAFAYALSVLLAVGIAAVMGAMNGVMALEAFYAFLRGMILFLAVYSIAVLAAVLAGHAVVAGALAALFLGYETLFYQIIRAFMSSFFRTFYGGTEEGRLYLSPVNYFIGPVLRLWMETEYEENAGVMSGRLLYRIFALCWKSDLANLAICAGALALAYLCYRRRRAESAGQAIVFKRFCWILKVALALLSALFIGMLIGMVYDSSTSTAATVITILGMLFTTAFVCCAMEVLFDFNIRAAFRKAWQIALVGTAAVLVFAVFRFDLTGYDSYAPDPGEVESTALYTYDYYTDYYDTDMVRNGGFEEYYEENMFLNNIEAVEKIALQGQENRVANWDSYNAASGWEAVVLYRMKNGKKIYRSLTIPYTVAAQDMDAVIGTKEYREGYYQVYQQYQEEALEKLHRRGSIVYSDGYLTKEGPGTLYEAFAEAYRKDLEQYNYTLASTQDACGVVRVGYSYSDAMNYEYMQQQYEVYPGYTNTLAFLQENGLYCDPAESMTMVMKAEVTNYHNELWETEHGSASTYMGDPSVVEEYTDPEKIREILEAAFPSELCQTWKTADFLSGDYGISVTMQAQESEQENGQAYLDGMYAQNYMSFYEGQVPAFVEQDTELEG
ncbi:MAG: DUF6449 domain-containing protein [Eubacteriales bacterium]|nr:DUF6449 domain-containing protein [Eubacteriales bacterium]